LSCADEDVTASGRYAWRKAFTGSTRPARKSRQKSSGQRGAKQNRNHDCERGKGNRLHTLDHLREYTASRQRREAPHAQAHQKHLQALAQHHPALGCLTGWRSRCTIT